MRVIFLHDGNGDNATRNFPRAYRASPRRDTPQQKKEAMITSAASQTARGRRDRSWEERGLMAKEIQSLARERVNRTSFDRLTSLPRFW